MSNFDTQIQTVFFWLFLICVFLDGVLILVRHFIKDEIMEKKRMFLFYCAMGATMLFLFFLSQLGLKIQDSASWGLVAYLSGAGIIILGFFIFYTYPELWLRRPKGKTK